MIRYVSGSLFESPASTLVNTVNTVGVMGRGVAAEFKRVYPEMFARYRDLCEKGEIKIGTLWLYPTRNKSVLNFPTKTDWRHPSKPEYIEAGLQTFARHYEAAGISSIAFPALGCGNGGLDFERQVKPLMEKYLKPLVASVFIYPHRDAGLIPEHRDQQEMRTWLRSVPEELSFVEVWNDLRDLIGEGKVLNALRDDGRFAARVLDEPRGIELSVGGRTSVAAYEDLVDVWQQLRSYGFGSGAPAAPDTPQDARLIEAIFAQLPYVKLVRLAPHYADAETFERRAEYALQYTPRSVHESVTEPQLNLLSLR